jgi:hypothetical protein
METLGDTFPAFSGSKFCCKKCDYSTSKRSHYKEHLATDKHRVLTTGDASSHISGIFRPHGKYKCEYCPLTYHSRNGLWKHKKKCEQETNDKIKESLLSDKDLMTMLVKQNSELLNIVKSGTNNNSHSNNQSYNTNSLNKTFNIQFFLNETCKDAMNIDEFVSSIKPQLEDLEATGRLGYVEGISNIILSNLKKLNTHYRPLHCSDQKREVFYIKENNEWTKEDKDKPILTKAIKVIANENIKNISKWRQEYPDCTDSESAKNDLYLKIVSNSMSGLTKEEANKNINKIISNVAKQVTIDRNQID